MSPCVFMINSDKSDVLGIGSLGLHFKILEFLLFFFLLVEEEKINPDRGGLSYLFFIIVLIILAAFFHLVHKSFTQVAMEDQFSDTFILTQNLSKENKMKSIDKAAWTSGCIGSISVYFGWCAVMLGSGSFWFMMTGCFIVVLSLVVVLVLQLNIRVLEYRRNPEGLIASQIFAGTVAYVVSYWVMGFFY